MLYVAIGNLIVYAFSIVDRTNLLYQYLYFDRDLILQGQIWRLFTYVFTELAGSGGASLLLSLLLLFVYFSIGRQLELFWGTLRFNCYYLCGIVLMDLAGLLSGVSASTYYLNLSLFLAYATIAPDARFLLFYIIPIKAKYLAWFDILMTLWEVVPRLVLLMQASLSYHVPVSFYIGALFPMIAILNYALFFGSDMRNILPDFLRYRRTKTQQEYRKQQRPDPNWSRNYQSSTGEKPYRHKCTVCGRTDVTNPELEFRYCSRCSGYHCYCMDHINNHTHVQN